MLLPTIRRWLAAAFMGLLLVTMSLPLAMLPKTAFAAAPDPCTTNSTPQNVTLYHVEAEQDFPSNPVDAVGGYLDQWGVYVPAKPLNWSITQIAAINGRDALEMGWIVDPAAKPGGYGDTNLHLFVFTRHNGGFCNVYKDSSGNWRGNFHPITGASKLPGDILTQDGTSHEFLILHNQGAWWIGYGTGWIGYIDDVQWEGQFTQAPSVYWYGEVGTPDANNPQVEMGNGVCGSFNGSAKIEKMFLVRNGTNFWANAYLTVEEASNYYDSDKQLNQGPSFDSFRYGGAGTVFEPNGSCPG
jgi:neprosin-like protein